MVGHLQIELEGGHRLICYFKIFLSFCFYWLRRSLFPLVTFPPIICLIFYLNFVCFVQNLPERGQLERNKNFATSLESFYAWVKLLIFSTIMDTRSEGLIVRRIHGPRTGYSTTKQLFVRRSRSIFSFCYIFIHKIIQRHFLLLYEYLFLKRILELFLFDCK